MGFDASEETPPKGTLATPNQDGQLRHTSQRSQSTHRAVRTANPNREEPNATQNPFAISMARGKHLVIHPPLGPISRTYHEVGSAGTALLKNLSHVVYVDFPNDLLQQLGT